MRGDVVVLVNASAGSVEDSAAECAEIRESLHAAGLAATVLAVPADDIPSVVRSRWHDGAAAIVVAGGDGTVNSAAGAAADEGIVLGVLPRGTFNHFAKDLQVPLDIGAAAAWFARAEPVDVDVAEAGGRVYVNNATIGVYPAMVIDRDELRDRHGWGKLRAVPVAVARTFRRLPVHRLRLSIDGAPPVEVVTPFLFVGNGLFDHRGRRVGRRTSLHDHRLGVYLVDRTTRRGLLAQVVRARLRGIGGAQHMHRWSAAEVLIEADAPTVAIALDGEPLELAAPLRIRTRPGALRVLAAPEATT